MKKLVLSFALLSSILSSKAQDPKQGLEQIQKLHVLKKYEQAKKIADLVIMAPTMQNDPEAWLWKSVLDAEATKATPPCETCLQSSYDALLKYEAIQPDFKLIKEFPFNWSPIAILYEKYFDIAKKAYQEKSWESSFNGWDKCFHIGEIISKFNLKNNGNAIDTTTFLFKGYSAQNMQNTKVALSIYSKAIDLNLFTSSDLETYKYVLVGMSDAKNKVDFKKYLAVAKEKFPNESFEDFEFDFMLKNYSFQEKIDAYKTADATGKLGFEDYQNYGSIFSSLSKEQKQELDANQELKIAVRNSSIDAYKKSFNKQADGITAFNIAVLTNQDFNSLDDIQRSNIKSMQEINTAMSTEKDVKKKAESKTKADNLKADNVKMDVKMMELANTAIEWFEKCLPLLKDKTEKKEKASYKNAVNILANLFNYKMDKTRGKDVKAYDAADAKFKLYDEMASKL